MVNKTKIDFFNERAEAWDAGHSDREFKSIEQILNRSNLQKSDIVLDVAGGTGILAPYFLKIGIEKFYAIEISLEMSKMYKKNFPAQEVIYGDYQVFDFKKQMFDKIYIFNAFPHFNNYKLVFDRSFSLLKPGGMLIIAHSMNRNELNAHHLKAGRIVENDILISNKKFLELYKLSGFQNIVVENDKYFYSAAECLS